MSKTNQTPCTCEKTSCGCRDTRAQRCTCGESCGCKAECKCGGSCDCAAAR
ncbi:MAG: hypothetical protein KIT31_26925 [Deltaproteobacteria bacterium]|nr:hypothetical protein [Deltaproteobacteria bacterium]